MPPKAAAGMAAMEGAAAEELIRTGTRVVFKGGQLCVGVDVYRNIYIYMYIDTHMNMHIVVYAYVYKNA